MQPAPTETYSQDPVLLFASSIPRASAILLPIHRPLGLDTAAARSLPSGAGAWRRRPLKLAQTQLLLLQRRPGPRIVVSGDSQRRAPLKLLLQHGRLVFVRLLVHILLPRPPAHVQPLLLPSAALPIVAITSITRLDIYLASLLPTSLIIFVSILLFTHASRPTSQLTMFQVPSDVPSDIHPHTLHSRHRQFNDPPDMERFLSFNDHHRIRYTSGEGICIHDQFIPVRYEFTTVESSIQFQGDLRKKDLVDFYDVDVVWSNLQSRTDSFGKVKGIGAIQRLKLWRDRYTTYHSLSVLANKTDHQYREYDIHNFDGELRNRDDRAKTLRLNVHGRRGSVPDEAPSRRTFRIRQRVRSAGQTSQASPELGPSYAAASLDIRYLSIQFTHKRDYKRFIETWVYAHSSDREFNGVPFPPNHFELPSPEILPGQGADTG
ncbi:acetate kinase [Trichoderma arundinaceum]|uniref:Acetate kinase n=1 Tax=Trichoderma arundinaceum TaxID=490622 RepID=A0A395NJW2_TRIAR|nr:acetate kinase [Trichoderma arundinaceum]